MAIENKVYLNGEIGSIKKIKNQEGMVTQIVLGVLVMRLPSTALGNRHGECRTDTVLVYVRDPDKIADLIVHKAGEGDFVFISGVLCTVPSHKKFVCPTCHAVNVSDGTTTFVHPLYLKLEPMGLECQETVHLSATERMLPNDELVPLIKERRVNKGKVVEISEQGEDPDGYQVKVVTRKALNGEFILGELRMRTEISNRAYLMGNLCRDPRYEHGDSYGRVCTYQIAVNRKAYIEQDPAQIRTDYPWVKSLGDQAEKDGEALKLGSLVYIDGAIQSKDSLLLSKVCGTCGSVCQVKSTAMEIVPYHVEYLNNFNQLAQAADSEGDFDMPDAIEAILVEETEEES